MGNLFLRVRFTSLSRRKKAFQSAALNNMFGKMFESEVGEKQKSDLIQIEFGKFLR